MRIVFLGSGAFGLPTLQALREHEVAAVVSQPDKPAGRGMKLTPTPIAQWAAEHLTNVPLFKPADVNEASVRDAVRAMQVDAWVVIAFGQKLSEALLADRFAINLHASLLPRWRGAAPINAAILAGDTVTGNSVITLAQRMDAGLVLGQSTRPILPSQTAGELHDLLAADGPALVLEVLRQRASGTLQPVTQDEPKVTKARKLSKDDGRLDFTQPASVLRCKVHGLTPWPGVTVTMGELAMKVLRVAEATGAANGTPGVIVDAAKGVVACGGGTALQLLEVQPAGGKPMAWDAFVRGRGGVVQSGATLA
ncbi:MAG: methionyl-tRNA formyltransferase [Phycisphaerales bacterium]